jgi:hypothetical protein
MYMEECPFLSTYENDVGCFKDCALYNYRGTGGICPFKKIDDFRTSRIQDRKNEIELFQSELDFIRKSYLEVSNQYL